MLFCYRDFIRQSSYEFKYDIHCPKYFCEILSDYAAVRNEEIFPNVSLEYALSIYVILVEKLHIRYDTISSVLAFALAKEFDITHPLQLFHNFELRLDYIFNKELIDDRDIFLRFVNSEKSKAFSFDFNNPTQYYTSIKLFNETPVVSVSAYNTLPLPY
jgi:hypothetical protein